VTKKCKLKVALRNKNALDLKIEQTWRRSSTFDDVWRRLTTFEDVWGRLTTFADVWRRSTTFDDVWQRLTLCCYFEPYFVEERKWQKFSLKSYFNFQNFQIVPSRISFQRSLNVIFVGFRWCWKALQSKGQIQKCWVKIWQQSVSQIRTSLV